MKKFIIVNSEANYPEDTSIGYGHGNNPREIFQQIFNISPEEFSPDCNIIIDTENELRVKIGNERLGDEISAVIITTFNLEQF